MAVKGLMTREKKEEEKREKRKSNLFLGMEGPSLALYVKVYFIHTMSEQDCFTPSGLPCQFSF